MVKIKMHTTAAGPDGCYMGDKEYSVEEGLAKIFVAGGYAQYKVEKKAKASKSPANPEDEKPPDPPDKDEKEPPANLEGEKPDGQSDEEEVPKKEWPKDLGGGWYQLSDGEKIRGEEEAIQAQDELG